MDYAIVRIKGHQYKISEGEEVLVDKITGDKVETDVLLVSKGDKVEIGKPVLKDAKVSLKILGQEKGVKVDVYKYKSKSRYKRHTGFRSQLTRLQVGKIG